MNYRQIIIAKPGRGQDGVYKWKDALYRTSFTYVFDVESIIRQTKEGRKLEMLRKILMFVLR